MVSLANGLSAWAAIVFFKGRWHAVGGIEPDQGLATVHAIGNTPDRFSALSVADDFMRLHGDSTAAQKSKQWLNLSATEKQIQFLKLSPNDLFSMTRYRASCLITFKMFESKIRSIVTNPTPTPTPNVLR